MDNKTKLLELLDRYREFLLNNSDYNKTQIVLEKIDLFLIKNETDKLELNFDAIKNITEEDMRVFTSSECSRVIMSLNQLSSKVGWTMTTVLKLIDKLKQDILENKANKYIQDKKKLDELYNIIVNGLFVDNYLLTLDFINTCVEKDWISMDEAIVLNFYILSECCVKTKKK